MNLEQSTDDRRSSTDDRRRVQISSPFDGGRSTVDGRLKRLRKLQMIPVDFLDHVLPGAPGPVCNRFNDLCSFFKVDIKKVVRIGYPDEDLGIQFIFFVELN